MVKYSRLTFAPPSVCAISRLLFSSPFAGAFESLLLVSAVSPVFGADSCTGVVTSSAQSNLEGVNEVAFGSGFDLEESFGKVRRSSKDLARLEVASGLEEVGLSLEDIFAQ